MAEIDKLVKTAAEQGKKILSRYKNDPKFRAKANKGAKQVINLLKGKKSTEPLQKPVLKASTQKPVLKTSTQKPVLIEETPKAKPGDVIRINKTGERAVVYSADNKGNYKVNIFEQTTKTE